MKTLLDKKSSLIVSHKPVFVYISNKDFFWQNIPHKDLFSNTRIFCGSKSREEGPRYWIRSLTKELSMSSIGEKIYSIVSIGSFWYNFLYLEVFDLSCILYWRYELMHVNAGEEIYEERCVLVSWNLIGDRSLLFDILLVYMNFGNILIELFTLFVLHQSLKMVKACWSLLLCQVFLCK